jgi:hypothetical protein
LFADASSSAAVKNAKDDAKAAEWNFHNFVLGVRAQIAV